MTTEKLYHISEQGNIDAFLPRPSPSVFEGLENNVVFAISGTLLHNYLLPRDCPRVCYYATETTTVKDKATFFGNSSANFIVVVEEGWLQRIIQTTLYCYELPTKTFTLLDDCAGYFVSNETVQPLSVTVINNPFEAINSRKHVELRTLPTLWELAKAVADSSLNFSLIRMRNAKLSIAGVF